MSTRTFCYIQEFDHQVIIWESRPAENDNMVTEINIQVTVVSSLETEQTMRLKVLF